MLYNWQYNNWPDFDYNLSPVRDAILQFHEKLGHISGTIQALSAQEQLNALIDTLVAEALKTSEIEGEILRKPEVRSSIVNNLNLNATKEPVKDKRAAGIGQLMVSARDQFSAALTENTLFDWHRMLFSGYSGPWVGAWRISEDPMRVISGPMGRPKVHYEAPPSARVPDEMKRFILWFNDTAPGGPKEIKEAPLRAALVHLYFESIHPFEDGNGRIGRALAEKSLSQTTGRPVLLSLSQAIENKKSLYYDQLERAQKTMEITEWIRYFVQTILAAQEHAIAMVDFTVRKNKFFQHFEKELNERQLKVIRRMMEEGPCGFEGGINAGKYKGITGASKATATRDLQELSEKGILRIKGAGRSTHYELVME